MFSIRCCVVLALFNYFLVVGQYVQSPCPDIFDYKSDGFETYGVIRLRPFGQVSSVDLKANFTLAARLPGNYAGRIVTSSSSQLLEQFNRGAPITYKVEFPVTSPLPRLTSLTVNDNVLCYGPGDVPGPNQFISTLGLQHTLFLKPSGLPGFNQVDLPPNGFPSDSEVFIFNREDNSNKPQSWNPDFGDFFSQNEVPATRPPVRRPPPRPQTPPVRRTRPPVRDPEPSAVDDFNYNYFAEETTKPPRRPTPPPPPPATYAPETLPTPVQTSFTDCGVVAGGNERQPLIFNGQSYERGEVPWLVAIYRKKDGGLKFICGGTLVSDRHVVTAAHCMQQKTTFISMRDIVVKVGVYNLEDWSDEISITRTLVSADIHESYNATTLANDISIFTFDKHVEFNTNIRPACLWAGSTEQSRVVGGTGVVAGWGRSETSLGGQGEPRMVRLPIVSTATCRASKPDFHKLTSKNTLCAGDRNGAGPCLGDSGGGLYILDSGRWRLRGVVSLSLRLENGDNTCNLNEYLVFTDTAQYLSWMKRIISKL